MSNLQIQLHEKARLLAEVAQAFGEVTDEQLTVLNELDITIPAKVESWIDFIKEDIPDKIKQFKSKIQEYKDAIDKLELYKEKKELYLHNLSKDNELVGEDRKIVADYSVRRSVDEEQLDKYNEGEYTITLPANAYMNLMNLIPNTPTWNDWVGDYKYKCNVTSLPEDHPAIIKTIRPTIKIRKK